MLRSYSFGVAVWFGSGFFGKPGPELSQMRPKRICKMCKANAIRFGTMPATVKMIQYSW